MLPILGFQPTLGRSVVKDFAVTERTLSHRHVEDVRPVGLFKPAMLECLLCITEVAGTRLWRNRAVFLSTKHVIQRSEEASSFQRTHSVWRYGCDQLFIRVILDYFWTF